MFGMIKKHISVILMMYMLAVSASANTGVIKKVLGGDLLQIGDTFIDRLTGIKTPDADEPRGHEIYDFTKRELEGKTVRIFTWTTDNTAEGIVYDEDGHAFVEIEYWKGEFMRFNEVLLKKGYARVHRKYLPDRLKHYLGIEKDAR